MIIKLHGETTLDKIGGVLLEVIQTVQEKAGIEKAPFTLKDVGIGVLFNVNGEKMMLSSEIDGVVEPFTVHVELDSDGHIKRKVDNENESFLDDYSRAVAKGLESPITKEIESVYSDDDLVEVNREVQGDLKAVYYTVKETNEKVVRYYRNDVLVAEAGYK